MLNRYHTCIAMFLHPSNVRVDVGCLLIWCSMIFLLSHQPSLPLPPLFWHADKLMHGSAYACMGILAWRTMHHAPLAMRIRLLYALTFCTLYGISDEWHQSFIPGRDSDAFDWLADSIGAACAITGMQLLRHYHGDCQQK